MIQRCAWRTIVPALPLLAAAPALAQTCHPFWANAGAGLGFGPDNMAAFNDQNGSVLFAAGENSIGGYIYRWDGHAWSDVSATLPGLAQYRAAWLYILDDGNGPNLIADGWIQPGGVISNWARRWNGSSWEETPPAFVPPNDTAFPLMSCDLGDGPRIYGWLFNPATYEARIARWTGSDWSAISETFTLNSFDLIAFDDGSGPRLYLVGAIDFMGTVNMHGFARWLGGTTWEHPVSNSPGIGYQYGLAAYNDGNGPALFVNGGVYDESFQEFPGVGRWDGHTWVSIGGPSLCTNCVYARTGLQVFDDGSGPALYVTGQFGDFGGVAARGIARWNGQSWSAVGGGIHPGSEVQSIAVGNGPAGRTMFIGGLLDQAGGGNVNYVAAYVACPNCYANCDESTATPRLNVQDFICFLNRFATLDPYANCDGSTTSPAINVNDFVCFLNRFAAGCS